MVAPMLPLLLLACTAGGDPKDTADTSDTADSAVDTADSMDTMDSADTGDTHDSADTGDSGVSGMKLTEVVSGLGFVVDAVPSPDGSVAWLLGRGDAGVGVYRADGAGGAELVSGGWGVVLALTISTDGNTAYVVGRHDKGHTPRVYAVPLDGTGEPAPLVDLDPYAVNALTLNRIGSADRLTVAGVDPETYESTIYTVAAGGGSVAVVGAGFEVLDLGGVARFDGETTWVTAADAMRMGSLYQVEEGSDLGKPVALSLSFGAPAGIAATRDESTVLMSAESELYLYDVSSGVLDVLDVALPPGAHPGGLHRAHEVDRFAIAASGADGGAVFFLDWR